MQPKDQAAFAVWITGLPSSGKSTIASALAQKLGSLNVHLAVLESDVLRKLLPTPSTYDERDREYFYGSMAFIGRVLTDNGISVIFDATANRRAYRERARQQIARFMEVFVDSPLDTCIRRDPKGIYRKAREGQAGHVPGVQVAYEPPDSPEVIVHGDRDDPDEAAGRIIAVLMKKGFVL
jgi:adenylylsulfate kinase